MKDEPPQSAHEDGDFPLPSSCCSKGSGVMSAETDVDSICTYAEIPEDLTDVATLKEQSRSKEISPLSFSCSSRNGVLSVKRDNSQDYYALRPGLESSAMLTKQLLRNFKATRSELTALCLPPVLNSMRTIQPLFSCPDTHLLTDPLLLGQRPSETTVREAELCLDTK